MEEKQQFEQQYKAYTKDILYMCVPLLVVSVFYFGPRVLFLAIVAMLTARICDWLISFVRSRIYDRSDVSSVAFGLLIVLLMPANVPALIVVSAVIVAVLVAKEAFGGTGHYPFHPAAVGFCSAMVCWPAVVTQYPPFQTWFMNQNESFLSYWQLWTFADVQMVNGPSYYLKTTALPPVELLSLFLGNYAGPLGASSVVVVLACAVFLLMRKRIQPLVLLCSLGILFVLTMLLPRVVATQALSINEWTSRLQLAGYEMLTGATVFVAVFFASDPTLLPKSNLQLAIYGFWFGVFTFIFRYFGEFTIGSCFALLSINALSGIIQAIGAKKKKDTAKVGKA